MFLYDFLKIKNLRRNCGAKFEFISVAGKFHMIIIFLNIRVSKLLIIEIKIKTEVAGILMILYSLLLIVSSLFWRVRYTFFYKPQWSFNKYEVWCRAAYPDPYPDPGFWCPKTAEKKWSKMAIYLCPSYMRSLQPSKENIQHLKKEIY